MRANQMLYPPGLESFQSRPDYVACLVPISKIPVLHYATIALCRIPFDEFLSRKGVKGKRVYRKLSGGWLRTIGVKLPSGRHAVLTQYESHPDSFDVGLEVWRDIHVFREDFFLIRELIGVPDSSFQMCDGPVLWR
jgi:hypothetical protein